MDEEQVKYARDLAAVSHAIINFLGLSSLLPRSTICSTVPFTKFYSRFFFPVDLVRFVDQLGSLVTLALAI